jgi:hypothetical protein
VRFFGPKRMPPHHGGWGGGDDDKTEPGWGIGGDVGAGLVPLTRLEDERSASALLLVRSSQKRRLTTYLTRTTCGQHIEH